MKIPFFKMQAQGNDYVYCEETYLGESFWNEYARSVARYVSRRRFFIGSDGLILIGRDDFCDAKMSVYNADGSVAETCGNALRCVAYYLSDKLGKRRINVATRSGVRFCEVHGNYVLADMGKPFIIGRNLPNVDFSDLKNHLEYYDYVSSGNEHLVVYCSKMPDSGLIASFMSKNESALKDYNVEFFYKRNSEFCVSVYERGSGETLCCGSGAVAVYSSLVNKKVIKPQKTPLLFKGGKVFLETINGNVYLEGDVQYCYEGSFDYDND